MTVLHAIFTPGVTLLSIAVSIVGSFMTISFCCLLSLCTLKDVKLESMLTNNGLFFFMTFCMTGISVWSMNIIQLSSLHFILPTGESVHAIFSVPALVISFVVCFAFSFCGLYVSSKDKMFGKTKLEIVELFVSDAKKLSMKEIKSVSNIKMMFIIATQSLGTLFCGGMIAGSGVVVTTMFTILSAGVPQVTTKFSPGIVCAAIFTSWILFTIDFFVLFRLLSLYPREWMRLVSAGAMTGIITAVHFIGFAAVTYTFDPSVTTAKGLADTAHGTPYEMQNYTTIVCLMIAFCLIITAKTDIRGWLQMVSTRAIRQEKLIESIRKDPLRAADLIASYTRKHQRTDSSRHVSENGSQTSVSSRSGRLIVSPLFRLMTSCFSNVVKPAIDDDDMSLGGFSTASGGASVSGQEVSSRRVMRVTPSPAEKPTKEDSVAAPETVASSGDTVMLTQTTDNEIDNMHRLV